MGSFNVVCSLTSTQIHYRDACVFVLLKAGVEVREAARSLEYEHVERVIHGIYDDYGQLKADGVEAEWFSSVTRYDCGRLYFYVHQRAWDWAVSRYPLTPAKIDKHQWVRTAPPNADADDLRMWEWDQRRHPMPEQWQADVCSLLAAFYHGFRSPLSGYAVTGQYDMKSTQAAADLARLTLAICTDRLQDYGYELDELVING